MCTLGAGDISIRVFLVEDVCAEGRKLHGFCRLTSDNGLDERGLVLRVREDGVGVENVPDGHVRKLIGLNKDVVLFRIFCDRSLNSRHVSVDPER